MQQDVELVLHGAPLVFGLGVEKVVYGVEDQIDLALLEEQRLFGAMLQVAHVCKDVVLCATLLIVLSQDRGGVLGRVAQQALCLIRIPDSSDRDLLGHVRGAVLLDFDDMLDGLRGMDRYCRLEQAPLIHEAVVPLADLE